MKRDICTICGRDVSDVAAQLRLDGSRVCVECASAVVQLQRAARPEARDDGKQG